MLADVFQDLYMKVYFITPLKYKHIYIRYSNILNSTKNLFSELILSIPQNGHKVKNKKNIDFKSTSFNRN